jgi:hypothetical protein
MIFPPLPPLDAQLALEWRLWILLNGLPAIFASTMFLLYRPFALRFGWDVIPRASAVMMGVGFLMRTAMYIQQFTAGDYQEMQWLHWGNVVFAGVLLGVTCIWGDTFHWRRFIAIVWLFLYIEEPVWMLTLWPRSEAMVAGQPPLPGGPIGPVLQSGLLVEAAIMLIFGVLLFLYPRFKGIIPWQPDLTSAKILSGWPLSYAVWAPALALAPSWGSSRGGVIVNIVWLAAVAIALLVFRKEFDWSQRSAKLIFGVCAVLALWLAVGVLMQGRLL